MKNGPVQTTPMISGWFSTHPIGSFSMGMRCAVGSLCSVPADFSCEQADQYPGPNTSDSCGSAVTPFPICCSNCQIMSWWQRAAISWETPSLTLGWVGEHILLKSVYFQWVNLMCGRLEKVKTFDFCTTKVTLEGLWYFHTVSATRLQCLWDLALAGDLQ